jgi:fatty acid desaturase
MVDEKVTQKIHWYRSPVDRDTLAALNQRSDWLGFLQTFGHLGLLALTGAAAWAAVATHQPWWLVVLILFVHGTFYAFLLNAFHEFCHSSVFKTRQLNTIFLYIISFLSWHNPFLFWASHQEHHKFTLHPPDDLEVILPVKISLRGFLQSGFINPLEFVARMKWFIRHSRGVLEGEWENALYPPERQAERQRMSNWARFVLAGHILLVAVSLALGWWMLPVIITLAGFYGGWLQFLCNNTQHIGLQDNVPDYRLCTRTIILNPFVRFLYWHMNFHIEHHMYAAVPCYRLGKLHEAIKDDLPPSPVGLVAAWKEINAILQKQKVDPAYQHIAKLPSPALRS